LESEKVEKILELNLDSVQTVETNLEIAKDE
jgi:hypothetical protein